MQAILYIFIHSFKSQGVVEIICVASQLSGLALAKGQVSCENRVGYSVVWRWSQRRCLLHRGLARVSMTQESGSVPTSAHILATSCCRWVRRNLTVPPSKYFQPSLLHFYFLPWHLSINCEKKWLLLNCLKTLPSSFIASTPPHSYSEDELHDLLIWQVKLFMVRRTICQICWLGNLPRSFNSYGLQVIFCACGLVFLTVYVSHR